MYELLLNERAVRVHLDSIKMSLSQSQAREGQEGADVSAESGQTELHCKLCHWDSASWGERKIILQHPNNFQHGVVHSPSPKHYL